MIQDIIDSKAKFIREYMNDHNLKVRWLRGIFMDEEEKINAILDCMDNIEEKAKVEQHKLVQSIVEMIEEETRYRNNEAVTELENNVDYIRVDSLKAKLLEGKSK